jgi:UDP-glucuronate 4-epimerase
MKILITGSAGFIGFHLSKKLLELNHIIYGIDNLNNYYDTRLKKNRIKELKKFKKFHFKKLDLANKNAIHKHLKKNKIDLIINMAAQAGVRYSISYPQKYFESNVLGFFNLIEIARENKIKNIVSASTSSVYGENKKLPFSEEDRVDNIIQFYAASKRSNEIMGQVYSKIYMMNFTFLRFFTVYGPWGRPDMALAKFVTNIIKRKKIDVFNMGNHQRDFTYIDDIVDGIIKASFKKGKTRFRIYNLGNGKKVSLMKYISIIEKKLGLKAKINFKKLQTGDVQNTWSNLKKSIRDLNYLPKTKVEQGISNYIDWFRKYYKI